MKKYSISIDLGTSVESLDGLGTFTSLTKAKSELAHVKRHGFSWTEDLTRAQRENAVLMLTSDDTYQDTLIFASFTKKYALKGK